MDFVVSLAHFCETHGPRTVLCTQVAPIRCVSCFPVSAALPADSLSKASSFSNNDWEQPSPITPVNGHPALSPFTSPPLSPRSLSGQSTSYFCSLGDEHSPTRRFSINSETEGDACESCSLTVPKDRLAGRDDAQSDLPYNHKPRDTSPVLRSSHSIIARGRGSCSAEEEDDDGESEEQEDDIYHENLTKRTSWAQYSTSLESSEGSRKSCKSSTASSPVYNTPQIHRHSLTYVTRRQPESQSVYSRLRQSCIRALSTEALPRGASSGPLSFGDDIAGYCIAYVFRLPDPRARGRIRTYALMALVRDNARAMAAFFHITKTFEAITNRILFMTDFVLEHERSSSMSLRATSTTFSHMRRPSASLSVSSADPDRRSSSPCDRFNSSANSPISSQRNLSDISSFLVAKRVDPDGYGRMSQMRPKGLPEIVGKPDFFADLHIGFSSILYKLMLTLPR